MSAKQWYDEYKLYREIRKIDDLLQALEQTSQVLAKYRRGKPKLDKDTEQ